MANGLHGLLRAVEWSPDLPAEERYELGHAGVGEPGAGPQAERSQTPAAGHVLHVDVWHRDGAIEGQLRD